MATVGGTRGENLNVGLKMILLIPDPRLSRTWCGSWNDKMERPWFLIYKSPSVHPPYCWKAAANSFKKWW